MLSNLVGAFGTTPQQISQIVSNQSYLEHDLAFSSPTLGTPLRSSKLRYNNIRETIPPFICNYAYLWKKDSQMFADKLSTLAAPFVGRTDELNSIADLLADPYCRLLTL